MTNQSDRGTVACRRSRPRHRRLCSGGSESSDRANSLLGTRSWPHAHGVRTLSPRSDANCDGPKGGQPARQFGSRALSPDRSVMGCIAADRCRKPCGWCACATAPNPRSCRPPVPPYSYLHRTAMRSVANDEKRGGRRRCAPGSDLPGGNVSDAAAAGGRGAGRLRDGR